MDEHVAEARPDAEATVGWKRLTAIALFAQAALFVVTQFVNEVLIPPLVVFAVVGVALGFLLFVVKGRWVLYVAAGLGVVSVLASAPFLIADLTHVETFAGFVLSLAAVVLGAGIAVSAVVAAREDPPRGVGIVVGAMAVVLVVGAAVSLVTTLAVEDDRREAGDVVVVARDATFPAEIEVPSGHVGLFVENDDVYRHTLVIEETGDKVEVPGSTNRRLETELASGTYSFLCDVPGHEAMKGTLVVR